MYIIDVELCSTNIEYGKESCKNPNRAFEIKARSQNKTNGEDQDQLIDRKNDNPEMELGTTSLE